MPDTERAPAVKPQPSLTALDNRGGSGSPRPLLTPSHPESDHPSGVLEVGK